MKETYHKHYIKRDNATLKLMESKGAPVVGDFIRDARITQDIAEELNSMWKNSGVYWVKPATSEDDEKAVLWAKIDEMVEAGQLEKKPHPATGIAKLKEIVG